MKDTPVEVWGRQQNAVVNGQLESATESGLDADHERHVRELASELADVDRDEE